MGPGAPPRWVSLRRAKDGLGPPLNLRPCPPCSDLRAGQGRALTPGAVPSTLPTAGSRHAGRGAAVTGASSQCPRGSPPALPHSPVHSVGTRGAQLCRTSPCACAPAASALMGWGRLREEPGHTEMGRGAPACPSGQDCSPPGTRKTPRRPPAPRRGGSGWKDRSTRCASAEPSVPPSGGRRRDPRPGACPGLESSRGTPVPFPALPACKPPPSRP